MDRLTIYNHILNDIEQYDDSVYVAQRFEPIPEQIPCAFVQMISKARIRRYADLENTDEQHRLTFEAQVFHETLEGAYDLMNVIEESFKSISFFEEMCEPVDNADVSYSRLTARFSAQVGDNDLEDGEEVDGGSMSPWTDGDILDGE